MQTINVGTTANDGTGDNLRVAMQKINSNFSEVGAGNAIGNGSPEGVVSAPEGKVYWDKLNKSEYVKESGTGNTGWYKKF